MFCGVRLVAGRSDCVGSIDGVGGAGYVSDILADYCICSAALLCLLCSHSLQQMCSLRSPLSALQSEI